MDDLLISDRITVWGVFKICVAPDKWSRHVASVIEVASALSSRPCQRLPQQRLPLAAARRVERAACGSGPDGKGATTVGAEPVDAEVVVERDRLVDSEPLHHGPARAV